MTYYRRIVNARGTQKWHCNDRKDVRHRTLPHFWRVTRPRHSTTLVQAYSMLPLKMLRVLQVEHRTQTARQLSAAAGARYSRGYAEE